MSNTLRQEKAGVALPRRGANSRRRVTANAAFAIVAFIFFIPPPLLNLALHYSLPGGSVFEKFHPASWLGLLLFVGLMQSRPANTLEKHYRTAALLFGLICLVLAVRGAGSLMSTLVDVQMTPVILLAALSRLNFERSRAVLASFVWIAAFNVALVAFEFAVRSPILPRESTELFFRPSGLFGHPISAGVLFCCAMVLVTRGVVGKFATRPLMTSFLLATALCGVRGPLAIATAIFLINLVRPALPRRGAIDYVLDFGVVIAAPMGAAIAYAMGAFDRVLALGVWEESSQSRVSIFDALQSLTNYEFWWGVDGYDQMAFLTKSATGGQYIENSFVFLTFASGALMAIAISLSVLLLHAPAMRRSVTFSLVLALSAFATIGFTTKGPSAAGVALAGYFVWRSDYEKKRRAQQFG